MTWSPNRTTVWDIVSLENTASVPPGTPHPSIQVGPRPTLKGFCAAWGEDPSLTFWLGSGLPTATGGNCRLWCSVWLTCADLHLSGSSFTDEERRPGQPGGVKALLGAGRGAGTPCPDHSLGCLDAVTAYTTSRTLCSGCTALWRGAELDGVPEWVM